MKKSIKIKIYNNFPKNESELYEEGSCWSWVFDVLPYIRNVHDVLFGRSISIGWLFFSVKFIFEQSLNEYVNENVDKTNDNGARKTL